MRIFNQFFCLVVFLWCLVPSKAFPIDVTPPVTSASQPGQKYSSSLTVTLRCDDYWDSGCGSTFYCLGEGCDPVTPYIGTPIRIIESSTLRFYSVDKASNAEAVKAENYTVVFPDKVAPVANDLVLPPLYRSLTVPIIFSATDIIGVTGYCLTETADPATCSWTQSSPYSYTFAAGGSHTLYAYAKDAGGNISAPLSASLEEDPNFIRLPQMADMVYAKDRDILYLTSGGSIMRYQVATRSFLSPYQTSGTLSGIDLSPDGRTLAVADSSRMSLYLVNLDDGSITHKEFTPATDEIGFRSVAFGADGSLVIASQTAVEIPWIAATPLRRFDPATGDVTVIANLKRATLIANSDRSCLAVEEGSNYGIFGIYDVTARRIDRKTTLTSPTSVIGISRDCAQIANSGDIYSNEALLKAVSLPSSNSGLVYHPHADVAFAAIAGSATLTAYETRNFRSVGTYDSGNALSYYKPLRIASDGSMVFASVEDGVEIVPLSPILPQNQSLVTNQGRSVSIQLKATAFKPEELSFWIDASPQHGTLTGAPPDMTYTPDAFFEGSDSFAFMARTSTGEEGRGTVTITVAHDVLPPVITSFTVPASTATTRVPVTTLSATDNVGVTEYCLTSNNSTYNCTWAETPPTSFDFTNTYNVYSPRTLYLFVKDAAGNVSQASAAVSINTGGAPPPTPEFTLPGLSGGYVVPVLKSTGATGTQYCLTELNDVSTCTPYSWESFVVGRTLDGYGPHTLYLFAKSVTGVVSAPASATTVVVGATGNEIPLDMSFYTTGVAYESGRHTLFVVRDGKLLRYDMQARSFLTPLLDGKSIAGVDVSADGNLLVAGNAAGTGIYLVDLRTESSTQVDFTPVANESRTSGVVFGSDGAVFAWGSPSNSGSSIAVRRYDPATGEIKIIATLTGRWYSYASVSPSPGGKCIGINDGNGSAKIYDTASQTFTFSMGMNSSSLKPNRDCSQVAVGDTLYDGALTTSLWTAPSSYAGVSLAYNPVQDVVYRIDGNTVTAYDTNTFAKLGTYPVRGSFAAPGTISRNVPLTVSPDGSFVFAHFNDGIGYAKVTGVVAENQTVSTDDPQTPITLLGRSSRTATLTYRIVTPPSHGTLSGTAPNLVYIPDFGYLGTDSITFSVNDGSEESDPAAVTISIRSSQPSPQTATLDLPGSASSPVVPVNIYSYGNSTADFPVGPVSWCLTETPSAAYCTWSSTKPAFYAFSGNFPQGFGVRRTLYGYVMDGTGKISRPGAASVVITRADTTPPVIVGFSMPETYPSRKVPFTLLTGDNIRTGLYCLSETDDPTGCFWEYVGNGQLTVTLNSYDSHIFYAFARDAGGNISASAKATVYAYKFPEFTAVPEPSFLVGSGASYRIVADGYPVPVLTLSGSLPAGVVFTANGDGTATISGTPEAGSAGIYKITVTADTGIGYTASKEITIAVTKVKQTMTYAPIPSKAVTDPPFTISAVASSGLPVTLTSSNPTVAIVNEGTISIRGTGYTAITAMQPGDGTYEPVSVTHILNVGVKTVESVLTLSALRDGDSTNAIIMNVAGMITDPGNLLALAVNGSAVAVEADGFFSVAVGLVPGANMVATTASLKDGNSVTDVRQITLADLGSPLDLSTPADGSVVNGQIVKLSGTGGKGEVQVSINSGAPVTVTAGSGGSFSVDATLAVGLNTVLVSSVDEAGNLLTAKRTLRFEADHPSLSIVYPDQDSLLYNPYGRYQGPNFEMRGETGPGTDVTVTVEMAGEALKPQVVNGRFSQRVNLHSGGNYPIKVTAQAKGGGSSTTIRNIVYVSGLPDGILIPVTGKVTPDISDALRALQIAVGALSPTLEDFAHGDVAPLQQGVPEPDGSIGVQDALLILERVVGLKNW